MYVRPQVELLTSIAEGIYAASGDIYGIDEPPVADGAVDQRSGTGHAEKVQEDNWGEGAVQTKFMIYLDGEIATSHLVVTITFDQDVRNGWGGGAGVTGTNPLECDIYNALTEFDFTVETMYPGVSITEISWRAAE